MEFEKVLSPWVLLLQELVVSITLFLLLVVFNN